MALVLRQAFLIASKDTRIFFKDRFAMAFAFLFPFIFIVGWSAALSGQGPRDEPLDITLVTQEEEGISLSVIEELSQSVYASVSTRPYDDALAALQDGEIDGFVVFPADFTQKIVSGASTSLGVVVNDDNPDAEAALSGFAQEVAGRFTEAQIAFRAAADLAAQPQGELQAEPPDRTSAEFDSDTAPTVGLVLERVGDVVPFRASNFTLPAYLTMFVFFSAALSAEAIARERQNQTLERLMSNGTRRESIVLGKFIGTAYRSAAQLVVMWLAGILLFDIYLGTAPVAVIAISVLMALASAAFGVLLASFVRSVQAAGSAGVLTSLVLAPIGGCWWPLFIAPQWMQSLAKLTPHGWANGGFNKLMLFGAEAGEVTQELGALVAFAAAFLAIALWRFRTAAQ
ncbi:MAG: ABC transporter permease [Chloroflexota bacterium]|nr:ABC transporter permease [Chloroflexota bacterium]MDE2942307.1 ABC transporter permease [Chloroflexota bacterium]MDE3268289.1 ABC transporter permease [Chloroflexota bacterium]